MHSVKAGMNRRKSRTRANAEVVGENLSLSLTREEQRILDWVAFTAYVEALRVNPRGATRAGGIRYMLAMFGTKAPRSSLYVCSECGHRSIVPYCYTKSDGVEHREQYMVSKK